MDSKPSTFVVVQETAIVFRCETLDEGLAFLEGRGSGVLYRLLCGPRIKPSPVQQANRKNPRETETRGQRKAS